MANIIESFDGTNGAAPSGVATPGTGIVDIQSNKLRIQTGTAADARSMWTRAGLANGDLVIEMTPASADGQRVEVLVRSSSTNSYANAYAFRAGVSGGSASLQRYASGTATQIATASFAWVAGVSYKIRFRFAGSAIQAKVWRTSESEPTSWLLSVTDATYAAAGSLGVSVSTQSGTRIVTWDNLQVADLDTSSPGGAGVQWASKGDTLGGAESGTFLVPVPSGTGLGDIVIVDLYKENNRPVTNSSGFQEVGSPTAAGGSDNEHHHQFWKRSNGVEPANGYSFQYSTSGLTGPQTWRSGVANRYTGADPTGSPIEALNTASDNGNDTVSPAVLVETLGPNRLLVWSATVSDYADLDVPPSGFTPRVDDGYHIAVATRPQANAGSSGNVIGEFSVSSPRTARLLALRPASSGPAADPPTVNGGIDATIDLGATFTRTATVSDGGATVTAQSWRVQSGPVSVGNTLSTTASVTWTPTAIGTYVLRFSATNSAGTVTDDVTVTVTTPAPPPPLAEPPETFHLDPRSWYLGPLGDLRELDDPESVNPTQVKYAGAHRGLSGAYVEDFLGVRSQYEIEFNWLEFADYQWLNSINVGHQPAPYFLRDPMLKNRLSSSGSRLVSGVRAEPGLQMYGEFTFSRDIPAEAPDAGRSITIEGWPNGPLNVFFDGSRLIPAFPGEAVTGSVYLKADGTFEGMLFFEYYDEDRVFLGRSDPEEFAITDDWERFEHTYVTPVGVSAMRMRLDAGDILSVGPPVDYSDGPLSLCAPQIEAGSTATGWQIGGALVEVSISEFDASAPRYPYWHVDVTFMEA